MGKFLIGDAEHTGDRLSVLFSVMQNFVVLDASYDYCRQGVEYLAISPMFDTVPDGGRAPEYEILVTSLGNVCNVQVKRLT
jgi:hypothetical protein